MDHVTARRVPESLSGKSPAGRTFAEEFAKIQQLVPSIEEEIGRALQNDPEFAPLLQSGVRAVANLRVTLAWSEFGKTPTGTLWYFLWMPSGEETAPIQHELRIWLSHAGSPIFSVNGRQFTGTTEAVLIMKTAIQVHASKRRKAMIDSRMAGLDSVVTLGVSDFLSEGYRINRVEYCRLPTPDDAVRIRVWLARLSDADRWSVLVVISAPSG